MRPLSSSPDAPVPAQTWPELVAGSAPQPSPGLGCLWGSVGVGWGGFLPQTPALRQGALRGAPGSRFPGRALPRFA